MWRYIWEYVCVEERASEAPPAVVRRMCGCVGLYVWWRERESERLITKTNVVCDGRFE